MKKSRPKSKRRVLTVDVGGTHVKFEVSGNSERREFESGPKLSAKSMVATIKKMTPDWHYISLREMTWAFFVPKRRKKER